MKYAGIDGCKKGWVCICLDDNGQWEIGIYENIEEIFKKHKQIETALIDVPIGLPYKEKRACDTFCRKLLTKKRASSVFPVPSREAVYAIDYKEACLKNEEILEKKLSKQTWNISNKIKEIDKFLMKKPKYQYILKEAHPELNFYGWNLDEPMAFSKKTLEGRKERAALLSKYLKESERIISFAQNHFKSSQINSDDVLDAMVLALSATKSKALVSLPGYTEKDKQGLDMKIWYFPKNEEAC